MAERPALDFITDSDFRKDLETDYGELEACIDACAWKAVHVLAGSIIEAVLVDYLVNTKKQSQPDPLKMSFDELISASKKANVLGQKSSDLSKALKNYRNLIHPGRRVRLEETVDSDGALVAQALVRMILKEVAEKQQKEYGLTAEQMITKFESDPSALAISAHLLKDAPVVELERLLLNVLPPRVFERIDAHEENLLLQHEGLPELETLFREAFKIAPESLKKKVMRKHVEVLREESGPRVSVYEERFFRASDLDYVPKDDLPMVRDHLFSRLNNAPSVLLFRAAEGLGEYLEQNPDQISEFVDPFVRVGVVTAARNPHLAPKARAYLESEADITPMAVDPLIIDRLAAWERTMERQERETEVAQLRQIKSAYEAYSDIESSDEDSDPSDGEGEGQNETKAQSGDDT